MFFFSYRERREKERKDKEKRDFAGSKDGRDIRGDPSLHREHLASSKPSKCEFSVVKEHSLKPQFTSVCSAV